MTERDRLPANRFGLDADGNRLRADVPRGDRRRSQRGCREGDHATARMEIDRPTPLNLDHTSVCGARPSRILLRHIDTPGGYARGEFVTAGAAIGRRVRPAILRMECGGHHVAFVRVEPGTMGVPSQAEGMKFSRWVPTTGIFQTPDDHTCTPGANFVAPADRHIDPFDSTAKRLGQHCRCGNTIEIPSAAGSPRDTWVA